MIDKPSSATSASSNSVQTLHTIKAIFFDACGFFIGDLYESGLKTGG